MGNLQYTVGSQDPRNSYFDSLSNYQILYAYLSMHTYMYVRSTVIQNHTAGVRSCILYGLVFGGDYTTVCYDVMHLIIHIF